ncbi:hypothetical protein [Nonomuraea recticatena]|uniref:Uncharacterized protein n=1 Tax=Nonomuraea recticatena TaxID=46178 RepID=A0ABP6FPR3_9ACTN
MISSPSLPLDLVALPNGDVLVLPAVWPVRLTPEQRRQLGELLLDSDTRGLSVQIAERSSDTQE